jgi:hypothetical protein
MIVLIGTHGINTKQKTQGYCLLNGDDKNGHEILSAMEVEVLLLTMKKLTHIFKILSNFKWHSCFSILWQNLLYFVPFFYAFV